MAEKEAFYPGKPGFSLSSPEYSWLVERNGRPVAILFDPFLQDMFWYRFRVEPISNDPGERRRVLDVEYWDPNRAEHENCRFVNCQTGKRSRHGFLGGPNSVSPGSVTVRGLIPQEAYESEAPKPSAIQRFLWQFGWFWGWAASDYFIDSACDTWLLQCDCAEVAKLECTREFDHFTDTYSFAPLSDDPAARDRLNSVEFWRPGAAIRGQYRYINPTAGFVVDKPMIAEFDPALRSIVEIPGLREELHARLRPWRKLFHRPGPAKIDNRTDGPENAAEQR